MRRVALIAALVLIAGCGKRDDLTPRTGTSLPVKPATALTQPSPGDLLATPPQAKPIMASV